MKSSLSDFKYLSNTQGFKFIILAMVGLALFGTLYISYPINGYIPAFLQILGNPYFQMMFLFIILYSSFQTYYNFDKNISYIIRLRDKKSYLKQLIECSIKNNIIIYIIQLGVIIIFLNFLYGRNLVIEPMFDYSISNIMYLMFFIIKSFIIYSVITIFNILFLKIFPSSIAIILHSIVYVMIPNFSTINYNNVIDSLLRFKFFIGDYLSINNIYVTFLFEICCNGIYISLMLILANILFNYSINHIKEIG